MTKDEMKNRISMALKDPILQQGFECICKENAALKDKIGMLDLFCGGDSFKQRRLDTFIQIADYIEKLEAQISVLLSCKNCQENKGGLICQKEYENKCLSQKIQYIKELQEEISELKKETRCECTRCVYSDSPCIRSDYGVENDEDVCPNYKNVFVAYTQLKEENAELKDEVRKLKIPCESCHLSLPQDLIDENKKLQEVVKLLYKTLKRQTCETDKNCPLHCPDCDIESVLEKARKVVKELDER